MKQLKIYDITSFDQLSEVTLKLLRLLDNRIFAFYGDMGVGKTTLIKKTCSHLQVVDSVSSPTFSIVNEYVNVNGDKIFHFDLYRLHNIEEAEKMGIDTYINSGNYCFIEWPELIEPLLPKNHQIIRIEQKGDKRELIVF